MTTRHRWRFLRTTMVMRDFDHHQLDAYRTALEFVVHAEQLVRALPSGRSALADQIRRASMSICLNTAEGAGEFSPAEKDLQAGSSVRDRVCGRTRYLPGPRSQRRAGPRGRRRTAEAHRLDAHQDDHANGSRQVDLCRHVFAHANANGLVHVRARADMGPLASRELRRRPGERLSCASHIATRGLTALALDHGSVATRDHTDQRLVC